MTGNGSITGWLDGLRNGDSVASQKCWNAYFARLVRLAQAQLANKRRTIQDPEDVALCALNSFYKAAQGDRFPDLNDRDDLWQILVMLTKRKAIDALRRDACRPPTVPLPQPHPGASSGGMSFDDIIADEPTPRSVVELAEEYQRLLAQLPDDLCRQVVELKLQRFTNIEIAAKLRKSVATVERKLNLVRKIWDPGPGEPSLGGST